MIEIIPDDPDVTKELAESARRVIIDHTSGRKCEDCAFEGKCTEWFKICPAYWR